MSEKQKKNRLLAEEQRQLDDKTREEWQAKLDCEERMFNDNERMKLSSEETKRLDLTTQENVILAASPGKSAKLNEEHQRMFSHQEELAKIEKQNALVETGKRLQKQRENEQQSSKMEKSEMERAAIEIRQRSKDAMFLKEQEMEYTKIIDQTHQAKVRDEAMKGRLWEDERVKEDLEMQEAIQARNTLLKQKLIEYNRIREQTEEEAKQIEANSLEVSKAKKERNVEEIGLDRLLEEERRKKVEIRRKNDLLEEKGREIEKLKLEMEKIALGKEKEKRMEVLIKQEAELNRFEQEIRQGDDERELRKVEKIKIIEKQKEQEDKIESDMLERQRAQNKDQQTKKDIIAQDTESFVAMQAHKREYTETSKREVEKLLSLHDENLKLEENTKRKVQKKRQDEEKLKQASENEKQELEITKLLEEQTQKRQQLNYADGTVLRYELRKPLESGKKQTEAASRMLHDERELEERELAEKRFQMEQSKRRQLQQEIMESQDAEMELLMKTRRPKATVDEEPSRRDGGKGGKGRFRNLFKKRAAKE